MKLAFYAPLKAPGHPQPSGDREMARALVKALRLAGHAVETVSELRAYSAVPHDSAFRQAARAEAGRIAKDWSEDAGAVPDAWFSYHPYYKAPDLLAEPLADRFGFPIVTAEASLAAKRDAQGWRRSQDTVCRLVARAAVNFCLTERDRPGVLSVAARDRVIDLPAFIDTGTLPAAEPRTPAGPVRLVTVAMMRPGVKVESYRALAAALAGLGDLDWRLAIAGDGSARAEVEAAFAVLPASRIAWLGEVAPEAVPAIMAGGDIFVWPGIGEAYGMVYLHAQAMGLPVAAFRTHGVPSVVGDGTAGLLSEPGDIAGYGAAIRRLIRDPALRSALGTTAAATIREHRTLEAAAEIIGRALARLTGNR